MPPPPKVALLIETSNAYARGLLQGVQRWIRENRPWSIYLAEHGRGDVPPPWLDDWNGDGIIARIENPSIADALGKLKLPIVDLSAARLLPHLPQCETDDPGIAQLAATHLLERGFRSFGYCGDSRFAWSELRRDTFFKAISAAGHPVSNFETPGRHDADDDALTDTIGQWLAPLPRPTAIFACYDLRGRQVLDACRRLGIAVPDEVAVLGVDNDEVLCNLAHPPLSSVIPNTMRTGYEAAALLDRMMSGKLVGPEEHLIPPIGIATRQSTDVLAVEDKPVARAVRYIRGHACEGICVDDVVRDSGLSRRLLETRFKRALGRSPHEEIVRVQIIRVKELLAETDLPLAEIAERAGFNYVEYLSAVFKSKVGLPPGAYRNEQRPRPPGAPRRR
ncbi:MAG: DNA-binding transcriptional regulator [Verrucomicrobiota bacterium]